jgi:hypothetical protein
MKRCVLCNKEGEFETARTKTCNHCKELKAMKKASLAQKRKIERLEKKKQKTVGVVRLSDLKKKAQRVFNAWIRRRDENEPCISCQKRFDTYEAGHYIAQGSSGYLRYEPLNVNNQCTGCNRWKHGNLILYRIGLVKKIGETRVRWLEDMRVETKKWTRDELVEIIERYT